MPVTELVVTDAELVNRARHGDQTAFGDLIDRHQAVVLRTALAALGSPDDAEDVAQEAFLSAYRALDTYRSEAAFKTWLLTITWRLALNRRRSISRRVCRMLTVNTLRDPPDERPSPEATALNGRLLQDTHHIIRALPVDLRDALLLTAVGEQRVCDVAAVLEIPEGTLKWRVAEARRRVKEQLTRRGWTDG